MANFNSKTDRNEPVRRVARAAATCVGASMFSLLLLSPAHSQITLTLNQLEPLSGPFQSQGEANVRMLDAVTKEFNAANKDVKFELVPVDSKGNVQEALNLFRQASEKGMRYFVGGGSSAIASGLVEAVNTYNSRNAGQEVLYLNHQAADPELTEGRCSFWHFRFDPHVDTRMQAIVHAISGDKRMKGVYLINQDYNFGQQVEAAAKRQIAAAGPGLKVVGDERHPIGKIKDFAPYVAKIKASGADAVITGNFGPDLVLLVKAAKDAKLQTKFFTFYGNATGAPTAVGDAGLGIFTAVTTWDNNNMVGDVRRVYDIHKSANPKSDISHAALFEMVHLMAQAARSANSADPKKLAFALEGQKMKGAFGNIEMRTADHQLLAPLFMVTLAPVDGKAVKFGSEGMTIGFETVARIAETDLVPPTAACNMKRPER